MMGWIKLYRAILDHWVYQDADYFRAWCTMLLKANHEPKKVLIRGEVIECGRGQTILSLQSWVNEFGVSKWSIQKVRTFFKLLENDKMINMEGMAKTTRITICKYDDYQNEQQTNNKQTTRSQHAPNMHLTTTKELKNTKKERKEENPPAKKAGGDYFQKLYDIFKNQYKEHRGEEYIDTAPAKEKAAIGKIAKAIAGRKNNQGKNTEQMLEVMDNFFNFALDYDDDFLQKNMRPSIILTQLNTLLSPKVVKKKYNPHKHVM